MTSPVFSGSDDSTHFELAVQCDDASAAPRSISNCANASQERPFVEKVMATEIDVALASDRPVGWQMPTLVIADRREITGAGIEALLQAGGYRVIARCSHEDDLLRSLETYRPDMIVLAENIVRQEAAETVLRLRGRNCLMAIILLLEASDAITAADLLELDAEGILLSTACARSVIDCVESVRHGRKWIDR